MIMTDVLKIIFMVVVGGFTLYLMLAKPPNVERKAKIACKGIGCMCGLYAMGCLINWISALN